MKRKFWLPIGLLLVIIALVAAGCGSFPSPTPGVSNIGSIITSQQNTGIWVSGEGKVTVVPDVAVLNVGVETQETTVAQAQSEASTAMNAVADVLGSYGVASTDIQTQQFTIYPVYQTVKDTGQQVLVGYRVDNTVTAKIRKVGDAGIIIDAVVKAGGNYIIINSISFTVDNPTPYQNQARTLAMADALSKAKQLADSAGVKLGQPTYINESGGYIPIRTVQPSYAGAGAATAAPPPISPGEIDITLDVQVVYSMG